METCVKGFAYMPETKETSDLKYVENEDLERTWKITRRERIRRQEQKVWEEFLKEPDIVCNMCQDDPYQFLDQVPEDYIKNLLDIELQKMKQEAIEEIQVTTEEIEESSQNDNQHILTFIENEDRGCNFFHVLDDEKDDEVSGPDEEALNDSINSSSCTVRERQEDKKSPSRHSSPDKISCKSSTENVTNMIENSVYCAKVKELRMKVNEELTNIMTFLETRDFINIDPSDVPKMMKHSVEFSARFNRVHLYQLQRQIADMERHSRNALPLARRTQRRARAARACSLHAALLHALQVLSKSLQQTWCIRESAEAVHGALRTARAAGEHADLQDDTIPETCDKLEETLNEYTAKMSDYLNSIENTNVSCSRKSSKVANKKKSIRTWSKSGNKSFTNADGRLSMYSLDTARSVGNRKSTGSKDNYSSGRPLMRAPATKARRDKAELGAGTLVEAVACTSSHVSLNASPQSTPKSRNTPRLNKNTPRTPNNNKLNTPRSIVNANIKKKDAKYNNATKDVFKSNEKSNDKINNMEDSRINNASIHKNIQSTIEGNETTDMKEMEDVKVNSIEKKEMGDVKSNVLERDNDIEGNEIEKNVKPKEKQREKNDEETKASETDPVSCEVTKLLRQLCGGDTGGKIERVSGAKNAQLVCVNDGSPRKPSTPQLLRILEETIQKKTPKPNFPKPPLKMQDAETYRMSLNIPERVKDNLFQYRTKFVQHMLTSSMYANSAVGKPWEKISSVSEKIIDELLLNCAKEMELHKFVKLLYKSETC